ncbi:MAG: hypothetical protein HY711_02100, partial [Candidatus Melainabacteria bacterium]|nr:hypothetical protein [Candidatus Melainabacteria bacterium]
PEPSEPTEPLRGGLRSPLLGAPANEVPHQQSPAAGLYSPLLGSRDYDEPASIETSDRESHRQLRSPLLGSTDSSELAYPEIVEEEDPNVLRSPLLAAKVPLPERIAPKPNVQPEDKRVKPPVAPATPPLAATSVSQVAPPTVSISLQPSTRPPAASQAEPLLTPDNLPSLQSQSAPVSETLAAKTPIPLSTPAQAAQPALAPALEGLANQALPSALPSVPSGRKPSPSPIAATRHGRLRTRVTEEDTSSEFAPESPQAKSKVKLLIWPLLVACALKIWSLIELHNTNQLLTPHLVDGLGQLIVIACLIVLCTSMHRKA